MFENYFLTDVHRICGRFELNEGSVAGNVLPLAQRYHKVGRAGGGNEFVKHAPAVRVGNRDMTARQTDMKIPSELIPHCPVCGKPMTMNLRADDTFVQDKGWYQAGERYSDFIRGHKGLQVLLLELGVGMNTPIIIKYPFWQMTADLILSLGK